MENMENEIRYKCEEDIITYDPISKDDVYIAISDNNCTTCDNIKEIKKSNVTPEKFSKQLKSLFGIDDNDDVKEDELWGQLIEKCEIERPILEPPNDEYYMAVPDNNEVNKYTDIILQRIGNKDLNAYKFIKTISKILLNIQIITDNLSLQPSSTNKQGFYNQSIRKILFDDNCSSVMIHDPQAIPLNAQLFLVDLANSNEEIFSSVVEYLNDRPQTCLEGTIETCRKLLNNVVSKDKYKGGHKKRKTVKRKSHKKIKTYKKQKTHKKRKTIKRKSHKNGK